MNIYLNNELITLPKEHMNVLELVEWRGTSPESTAVAISNRLIKRRLWEETILTSESDVTLISAAFGG